MARKAINMAENDIVALYGKTLHELVRTRARCWTGDRTSSDFVNTAGLRQRLIELELKLVEAEVSRVSKSTQSAKDSSGVKRP